MTTNSSQTAAPFLLKSIPYDPVKDFAPISRMGNLPFIMVIGRSVPANDFAEFVAYAKANPGKLNYASSNVHRHCRRRDRVAARGHPARRTCPTSPRRRRCRICCAARFR